MPPKLTPDQVKMASGYVASYISSQRDKYLPIATSVSATHQKSLSSFFSADLLANTRVLFLDGERLENPSMYSIIRFMGFRNLPDYSTMAAITFNDVVVSHEPLSTGLLFHELVHAEQYRQLGVERFAELYVGGFLKGGSYDSIPLEVMAYALEDRYRGSPNEMFSVSEAVREWIAADRL